MIEEVRRQARTYFADAAPAHDWHHVERVATLSETLAERQPRPVDREVLTLSVWLHDIGRTREDRGEIDDHAAWGAEEAGRICRDHGLEPGTIERVQHCVRAHRYSNDVEPSTVEARLLSDADNLDALGAVGVARVFAHGGAIGSPIHDPDLPVEADDTRAGETGRNHLAKKILDLPDRMYTDAGRELADERAGFVRRFHERLAAEAAGAR